MPPRQAKRARTGTTDIKKDSPPATRTDQSKQVVPSDGDNGKCKFIEIPVELLLEIMSYFPAVPVPTSRRYNTPVLHPSVFERWDVLRALSQTCRLWRNIFVPMLWERMEACAVRNLKILNPFTSNNNQTPGPATSKIQQEQDLYDFRRDNLPNGWFKAISHLLEKVSNGLSKDPEAAKHVRTVNVSLTRCSVYTVLPAFVECLERLPNLQTLQILRAHTQMAPMLKSYFEGHVFPTVRTVIIPEHGHDILNCCPGTRKVICNYGDGSKIITAIGKSCKNVKILEGIKPDKNFLKRLAKACPNLRELKLGAGIETNTTQALAALMPFKKLTRLEIQVANNYAEGYHKVPIISQIIKGGKDTLDNQVVGKKMLRLFYVPGSHSSGKTWTLDIPV